ncbi:hypothetical protein [Rubritalea marina]|uniref:hypothetical protein n=1 Tax=Rubritalea marina TaxID=361055 RepID=UPI0012EADB34|nr:hypothetical protein [Rubritalea marina]
MTIQGGVVDMSGGQVKCTNSPVISIIGDAATITMDRLNVNSPSEAATFRFIFDQDGVSPIMTNQWMTLSHAKLEVDGSAYAGGPGTFELFKSSNLTHIGDAQVTGTFPGLQATFSKEGNSWLLNLTEVLEYPQAFLEIMPTYGQAPLAAQGSVDISGLFESDSVELSRSPWTSYRDLPETAFDESTLHDEADVAYTVIDHASSQSSEAGFRVGIGEGGQIYSIRTASGEEAIPPQNRGEGYKKMAPWIDEVFQLVQQNINKHYQSGEKYFIHQAGTYHYIDHMEQPFYSPVLMAGRIDSNTYVMANWVQQGHLDKTTGLTMHKSESIVYTKYRVVADGVLEVSHLAHNFGADRLDFFNIPWGGVRLSTYPEVMLGDKNADGSVTGEFFESMPGFTNAASTVGPLNTGGWLLYAADRNDNAEAMALVFGAKNFASHRGDVLRFGTAGGDASAPETEWRNYNVTEVIRYQNVDEGSSLFARYYYVFGTVAEVKQAIAQYDLEEKTTVEVVSSFSNGPLYAWRRSAAGGMPTLSGNAPVHLELRDRPVNAHYKPVFLIQYDGDYIPTYDPYKHTNNKPYQRNTEHIGLLGYADTRQYSEADLN